MNQDNSVKLLLLFMKIADNTIPTFSGHCSRQYANVIARAIQLKRAGKYDEAIAIYISAIELFGCLYTNIGRGLSKLLCSDGEFSIGWYILKKCILVRGTDKIHPFDHNDIEDSALLDNTKDLLNGIVCAANGNTAPLRDYVLGVSGSNNNNGLTKKNDRTIQKEAQGILEQDPELVGLWRDFH